MKPQRCIAPRTEEGDCWRACIATVLNLPASQVPNFAHLAERDKNDETFPWDRMYCLARKWLAHRGVSIFRTYCSAGWSLEKLLEVFSKQNEGVPLILSGQCRRAPDDNHAVVAMNGSIVHDPSGSGIIGPCIGHNGSEGWWWIDVIAFTDQSALT